ncbi:hypothetical protein M199_gp176 [Halogranum tailed virus 1]|uniref:Uncharacterized protein n=1 Tax=Halogranum tailed virus 1 TaxID=1273749 RepID=R4T9A2_9CAUD|nr:hypothetical protein M199_gp176 [Halogranum tailed virus 1]AGM11490.1 hypothetical protein HGTV1_193 [Halogranum tailed virus 1]
MSMVRKIATCEHERQFVKQAIKSLRNDLEENVSGVQKVRSVIGDEFGDVEVRLSGKEAAHDGDWINIYEVEEYAQKHNFKKGSAHAYNEPIRGQIDAHVSMTFFYTFPEVAE